MPTQYHGITIEQVQILFKRLLHSLVCRYQVILFSEQPVMLLHNLLNVVTFIRISCIVKDDCLENLDDLIPVFNKTNGCYNILQMCPL